MIAVPPRPIGPKSGIFYITITNFKSNYIQGGISDDKS